MQKIQIENFGPIRKAEIEISKIVILIGEQASGKSTVSKLVYFFKSLKEDFFRTAIGNSEFNEDKRIAFIREIKLKFYKFFGATRHFPDFEIKYFYSDKKYLQLSLGLDKYLRLTFEENFYKEIGEEAWALSNAIKQPTTGKTLYESIAYDTSKSKIISNLAEKVDRLFDDDRTFLFIPAGRNITVTYQEQFKLEFFSSLSLEKEKEKLRSDRRQSVDAFLMSSFLSKVEDIKQRIKDGGGNLENLVENELILNDKLDKRAEVDLALEHISKIIKGKYRVDQFGEKIVFDRHNRYVYLENASSGQQESIRILMDLFLILFDKENVFRVIEEPEAHLYPVAQKQIIELIAIALNHTDSQIFITTHSPYILSIFNNLLFAGSLSKKSESIAEKVDNLIDEEGEHKVPKEFWISPESFNAYALKGDGTNISIFNRETKLIEENYLDEISLELADDFASMFEIYKKAKTPERLRKHG